MISVTITITFARYSFYFEIKAGSYFPLSPVRMRQRRQQVQPVIDASRTPDNGTRAFPAAMHRLLLAFLAAAGASVLGLGPCRAPLQWEGRWVQFDHSTGRNSRAAVSYDGLNQRLRVLQQHKKHTPCQK